MLRRPNRVQQYATYKTGSPNYVDVSSGSATPEMRTFVSASSSWMAGDEFGVVVKKDNNNWQVWMAAWDGTNKLLCASVKNSVGSLGDGDPVQITASLTEAVTLVWRDRLTADRTYYVSPTGSNSNDGLSAATPFATIQKAVDVVCSLDLSIYQATIQLADGTYTAGAVLKHYIGALPPIIQGNATTPANVVISTSGTCIKNESVMWWGLRDFKVTSSSAFGFENALGSILSFRGIDFGFCSSGHILAAIGTMMRCEGNYAISGSSPSHLICSRGGKFLMAGSFTVTLTGSPAFSSVFASVSEGSLAIFTGTTYSGSATGKRYDATSNAVVSTGGGGATYLPGNASGTTATGGQYV